MSKQPEALRLAYALENCLEVGGSSSDAMGLTDGSQDTVDSAAAELRRLHDLNGELLEALRHCADWFGAAGISESVPVQQHARAAIAKAGEQA